MAEGDRTPKLDSLSESPRNAEGRFEELLTPVTPTDAFYVRSNFPAPELDPDHHRLEVPCGDGPDGRPARLSLADLRAMGTGLTRTVTLECAGNGRRLLRPQPEGTPWMLGAVGTATFTGVPLSSVLPDLGDAVEVLFTGADRGMKEGRGEIPFQRSLPTAHVARTGGTLDEPLLVWEMNGEPLTADHGAPLRLIVPGWYAVASVKWLARIELLDAPFDGFFQVDRYRYLRPDEPGEPVTALRVRSLILQVGEQVPPSPGVRDREARILRVPPGTHRIHGTAWSGEGPIDGVDVSADGGETWRPAEIQAPAEPHGRAIWSTVWTARPGLSILAARARDAAGNVQPMEQAWNALGYGNNVVHRVPVRVITSGGRD